jgi:16S rRNA (cytosine967-C5)-methyltransferase
LAQGKRPQKGARPPQASRVDYARLAAARTLEAVPAEGLSLDEAFNRQAKGLSPRDRGFAWRLVRTAMRHHGPLLHLMTEVLDKGRTGVPPFIQAVIRLGFTDLLLLETPPHAAVSSTVNLLGTRSTQRYRGMVNAVLRRADRERESFMEILSQQPALPHWLADRWRKQWGDDNVARFDVLARQEAPVDVCLVSAPTAPPSDAQALPTGQFRFTDGFPAFQDSDIGQAGKWWVQDLGAHLPIAALGELTGKTAIDLCSAPGGKTLQLAHAGADVVSVDNSGHRLERVNQNLERTGLKAAVKKIDVLKYSHKPVDLVVLDAPCSASGTFRKNPEAPWLRSPTTLLEHARSQAKMLDKAVELVKPGGTLLYIVCSLEQEEGEAQAAALLARRDNVSLDPFVAADLEAIPEALNEDGTMRILPSYYAESGGVDGFFAARFKVA